jgi:hypothetical protein
MYMAFIVVDSPWTLPSHYGDKNNRENKNGGKRMMGNGDM